MMKKYLFVGFVFIYSVSLSQNLEGHIPSDASMVFEINLPQIIQAMPFSELEQTKFGREIIGEFSEILEKEITSFEELGINTSQSSYIFMDNVDSQNSMVYLFPINSKETIQKLIQSGRNRIQDMGTYSAATTPDEEVTFYWNSNVFSIVQPLDEYRENTSTKTYLSKATNSIASNQEYTSQKDSDAALSYWISDFANSVTQISGMLGSMPYERDYQNMSSLYKGYESVSMKLYLDKEKSRLSTELFFSDELSNTYKNISDQKYNTKLLNYVDLENCLGYFASNLNVENILTEYPAILNNQFAAVPEGQEYKYELEYGLSLLSVLLDEEAVGEVIRGDMLLVFNNLTNMEVEYTSYEYDSNFNQIPVTRTKTEKVPEFMFLASTKEGDLSSKTISYLLNRNLAERQDNFYKIQSGSGLPFEVYFMIKNDILFIGTSLADFRNISNDRYTAKVTSDIKKHIAKNQLAVFGGINRAGATLAPEDFPNERDYVKTKDLIEKSPDITITASKFKGNSAQGEISVKTPKGHTSGLSYLLQLLEDIN